MEQAAREQAAAARNKRRKLLSDGDPLSAEFLAASPSSREIAEIAHSRRAL